MRNRNEWTAFRHAVIGALFLVAPLASAKDVQWYKQPGTPFTLASTGFDLRAKLPQRWSLTESGFVPPSSSCRVRIAFHADRDWDDLLTGRLRSTDARMMFRIGDHNAVSNRYVRDSVTVRDIYIDLSELQKDSGIVWTFEGDATDDRSDCELQFLAMIGSARITRSR